MNLQSVKNIEVKGKRVIVRVDFNVLAESGKIEEIYRIKRTLPTLRLLKGGGAKIIIVSHLSSKKGESLLPVAEYFNKNIKDLNIDFVRGFDWNAIKEQISEMNEGEIIMLENLRNHEGEKANSEDFAKILAGLGDIYVNDAFSVSHRAHASIVGLPKFLPSCAGLLFEEEVNVLQSVFKPNHPFLLILGGIKFGSKLGVVDRFLEIADKIFIGGALANGFLSMKGEDIGESPRDENVDYDKYLANKKIFLPADVRKKYNKIYDFGPRSAELLGGLIKEAKFIVWNGPMGNIEEESFDEGTKIVARAIIDSGATSIVGGGDTVAVIDNMGILEKFSFVSTAGGAMLEFLANGSLHGIEALKKSF